MQDPSPEARRRLEEIAARYGVSVDAALALLRALAAGGGRRAQFSHPELGGMGQWLQSGMVMIGDMFNAGLKQRVSALGAELAALLGEGAPSSASVSGQGQSQARASTGRGDLAGAAWWPAELGSPVLSGAQNGLRYAYFPASHRLAVEQGGRLGLHDTGTLRVSGISLRQGDGGSLVLSTDRGAVRLQDLPSVDAPAAAEDQPAAAPSGGATGGDPLALIERLAELHAKGILTAEEFAAKKAELLGRL